MPNERSPDFQLLLGHLTQVLAELEKLLETPIVPGEMAEWYRSVTHKLKDLGSTHERVRNAIHDSQFSQIEQVDPEQLNHVQKMRAEDKEIALEIARLSRSAAVLNEHVDRSEDAQQRDESQLASLTSQLNEDALALIIRIRAQENSLRTWYLEAFDRDRGTAD